VHSVGNDPDLAAVEACTIQPSGGGGLGRRHGAKWRGGLAGLG
jgi:hypothetical protein